MQVRSDTSAHAYLRFRHNAVRMLRFVERKSCFRHSQAKFTHSRSLRCGRSHYEPRGSLVRHCSPAALYGFHQLGVSRGRSPVNSAASHTVLSRYNPLQCRAYSGVSTSRHSSAHERWFKGPYVGERCSMGRKRKAIIHESFHATKLGGKPVLARCSSAPKAWFFVEACDCKTRLHLTEVQLFL